MKVPKEITKEWLRDKFIKLNESTEQKTFIDNRGKYTPLQKSSYYESLVYNTYTIDNFDPEIEFCESKEQFDIWMFFRLKIASFPYEKTKGRNIKMLIRDKTTKKYIGITSLGSDILYCEARDKYIGWSNDQRIKKGKLSNIMNITTCVGIPPFSFNFNGGKLITMLMFSHEVYDYFIKKYKDELAALTTFSLYGKGIQYDRLKELKYIGSTKGFGTMHIPDELWECAKKYIKKNNLEFGKYNKKTHVLKKLSGHFDLDHNILKHENIRGIYLGYLGENSKNFLCGKENIFVPNLETCKQIGEKWKERWANQRFINLLNTKRLMIKYDFSKNVLSENDRKVINMKNHRNKYNNKKEKIDESQKIEIIKFHYDNPSKSYNSIAKKYSEEFGVCFNNAQIKKLLLK